MDRRSAAGPRFFVEGTYGVGDVVALRGEDARKLTLVLRARPGDRIEVCDSAASAFAGVVRLDGAALSVELVERRAQSAEAATQIVLAQAIPKGAKMDFVVEKATELGVVRIVPLLTERTITAPGDAKVERWRRLARTAAQQSGRDVVPVIDNPVTLPAFVRAAGAMRLLVPWELAEPIALRDRLPALIAGAQQVGVIIGPEGGLAHDEVDAAIAGGAAVLSLGSRILRTESAGLVVVSAIRYAAGEI